MTGIPVIPDTITVHLGAPTDTSAPNVTVPFPDYIKNVASSEIYPNWPENSLRANIYAQVSFALNRVYTEWYRSRGYNFDITNSTQYDQSFVPGRDYFENISQLVDQLFNDYLTRQGSVSPLFARYCNGTTSSCDGLSQWGTVSLAEQGYTPYEILRRYYGDDIDIVFDAPVSSPIPSYPGIPLQLGSVGNDVATLQTRLNRISTNYPAIPKIYPVDGRFTSSTDQAVRTFQRIFDLTEDGIVGSATWYRIVYLYTSVKQLADLNSEGVTAQEISRIYPNVLQEGDGGSNIWLIQYDLNLISRYANSVPAPPMDGYFGPETTASVRAFQQLAGLTVDGIVGRNTWNALYQAYRDILRSNPDAMVTEGIPLFPGISLLEGSTGDNVRLMQRYLNFIADTYTELPHLSEDGIFGPAMEAAVRDFQSLFGLPATGIIDAQTWDTIASVYADLSQGSQVRAGQYPGYVLQEQEGGTTL